MIQCMELKQCTHLYIKHNYKTKQAFSDYSHYQKSPLSNFQLFQMFHEAPSNKFMPSGKQVYTLTTEANTQKLLKKHLKIDFLFNPIE